MKKILFVFGLLLVPQFSLASDDAMEKEYEDSSDFFVSEEETKIETLKQHLERLEQKLEEIRMEREMILEQLRTVSEDGRAMVKEKREALKEEWKEEKEDWKEMREDFRLDMREESEELRSSEERQAIMPFSPVRPPVTSEKTPFSRTNIQQRNTTSSVSTPVFRASPWKKDPSKTLAPLQEFKISPKMLQQSVILSPDQLEARERQAEAKKRLLRYNKVFR